jgi:hypothetical protein
MRLKCPKRRDSRQCLSLAGYEVDGEQFKSLVDALASLRIEAFVACFEIMSAVAKKTSMSAVDSRSIHRARSEGEILARLQNSSTPTISTALFIAVA